MKLALLFFAIVASTSVSAGPVLVDVNVNKMTMNKREVGIPCKITPQHKYCIARRDMEEDQFKEVGLVKRTGRHVHHIPGHHGHIGHHSKSGKHGKKTMAMAPTDTVMAGAAV